MNVVVLMFLGFVCSDEPLEPGGDGEVDEEPISNEKGLKAELVADSTLHMDGLLPQPVCLFAVLPTKQVCAVPKK